MHVYIFFKQKNMHSCIYIQTNIRVHVKAQPAAVTELSELNIIETEVLREPVMGAGITVPQYLTLFTLT